MLTISERIPDFETYEAYLGYHCESAMFFDIETTGLSAASSIIFLIGIVRKCGGDWQLTQWLAQRPEDEPLLLNAFFDAAAACDALIHFNGTTFDLPFIRERARLLGQKQARIPEGAEIPDSGDVCRVSCPARYSSFEDKRSLDLYQKFRPLKQLLGLPRMNQATLEQFLCWPREDRLSGKHMIQLFQKYIVSQEPLLGDLLLLHNHDDLLGMTALLRLCSYSMLFEGQFCSVDAAVEYSVPAAPLPADPASAACPGGSTGSAGRTEDDSNASAVLTLHLALESALPNDLTLLAPCSGLCCTLTASGSQAVLSVPGYLGELRHFFPNWRDYYYLPLEDQVIHKSVGAFVGKEYRVPAAPASCCVKKSGLFFPQPEECFSPAFKPAYASKDLFFCVTEQELSIRPELEYEPGQAPRPECSLRQETALSLDPERLNAYAASLLRLFAHGSPV